MTDIQNTLPPDFLKKMETLLGDEYPSFLKSYLQDPHMGLRVNTLKSDLADFISKTDFALKPVGDYAPAGFIVQDESKPGSHPYHAAGAYYMQEPSAMAVAGLVDPQPGEWVLDLAAAPGGKATHLSALMADQGLLVANDIDSKRAKILSENLERWGARNALVINAHPDQLAQQFGAVFDRVLVDAPCSGEGMFRRIGSFAWSENHVLACARRQTAVLATAAQLVKPTGRLVYSTCTFSPEEDEAIIAQFLQEVPQFQLVDPPRFVGFARGRPLWVDSNLQNETLNKTVRLWPHHFAGEGHFIAVLQRTSAGDEPIAKPWDFPRPRRAEIEAWHQFARDFLTIAFDEDRLYLKNGRLYHLPTQTIDTAGIKLVRYGLLLGEIRKKQFKPHHALALTLDPDDVQQTVNLSATDTAVSDYLAGHEFTVQAPNGWTLLTVDGFALGWGKVVNGRMKNHYPHHFRRKKGMVHK